MNGPKWTDRQISFLLKNYGKIPMEDLTKKLNRNAKACRTKWQRLTKYEDKLRASEVARLFKVDPKTVINLWIGKYNLPHRRVYREYNIDFGELLEWLEAHQDLWDSKKLDTYGLGYEYAWLKMKRREDAKKIYHYKHWTAYEESLLKTLIKTGKGYYFASKRLGRSEISCRHKFNRLYGKEN